MANHDVVIAGAGPTGMMLAAELALAGVDAAVVERRPTAELAGSRAGGLHARSIEVLDQRGVAERFLAQGKTAQITGFAWIPVDLGDCPSRHPYGLALWQNRIELLLAGWLDELGVVVYRGRELVGHAESGEGVEARSADGGVWRARYLVGCDGGRSVVRKAAGIDFPGWDETVSHILAEVQMADEPEWGVRRDALGINGLSRMDDGTTVKVMLTDAALGAAGEPTLQELKDRLVAVYGRDFGAHSPTWISRFTDAARQASAYRRGRVLLAGDAAHVHYPTGGQGLNLGVQDAVNLGWKLAAAVKGTAPDGLLDSYHAERHPVAARVLKNALAQVALLRADEQSKAARDCVADLLAAPEPRRRYAAMQAGLDIRYELGDGHPLLGRRVPDVDLETAAGPRRLFTLLHAARPVLLNLGAPGAVGAGAWADRVTAFDARYYGAWDLPVLGRVAAPGAVLIRPDGHVAWVGDTRLASPANAAGLVEALNRWFGPA